MHENLTTPPFRSVKSSNYVSVFLSFSIYSASSIKLLSLSFLTVSPSLAVLTALRSHATAVFCSVMATGATPEPFWLMDR